MMNEVNTSDQASGKAYPPIIKARDKLRVPPNLDNYARVCEDFTWEHARDLLNGLPEGGLNIAFEAVDRHAAGARADRVALRWIGQDGRRQDLSYRQLRAETNRFANALEALGVCPGERVFVLAGRIPELYIAVLGSQLPGLAEVILIGDRGAATAVPGTRDWDATVAAQASDYAIGPTQADDLALLHFNSGTTGRPKGALHVHDAVLTML
ncbi:MAG: AMP-binding protein [Porticoccaceae bacterium]